MGLVSLAKVKSYLGEAGVTYDVFLQEQIDIISDAIDEYCERKFLETTYTQTFYKDQFENNLSEFFLSQFPITTITTVNEVDTGELLTDYRIHKPTGRINLLSQRMFDNSATLEVVFEAGYEQDFIPRPIIQVIYSLMEERYGKKVRGVSMNFGSDVQRIAIAGAISIDFDYSLQANDRKSPLGMILGNYLNVLDKYRSDRAVLGTVRVSYVE
jgi:hypothetical protein